jgi:N-formylmaleamate deformylase
MKIEVLAVVALLPFTALAGASKSFEVRVVGHGPPVILIPGLASSGEVWDGLVGHLKDRYECHVLTLAGFGGTAPVDHPSLVRVRDELSEYLQAHHLERPVVIGHSLGGFLAFGLASAHPEQVGKVISVDGLPFYSTLFDPNATEASMRRPADALRQAIETQSRDRYLAQSRASARKMTTRSEDADRVADWGAKSDPWTVAAAMAELMTTDLRGNVGSIQAPTLLVGAGNGMADLEGVRRAYSAQIASIPDHRLVVEGRSRHFVMLDEPAVLAGLVDAFLACAHAADCALPAEAVR